MGDIVKKDHGKTLSHAEPQSAQRKTLIVFENPAGSEALRETFLFL
jgi:hypothetical protein